MFFRARVGVKITSGSVAVSLRGPAQAGPDCAERPYSFKMTDKIDMNGSPCSSGVEKTASAMLAFTFMTSITIMCSDCFRKIRSRCKYTYKWLNSIMNIELPTGVCFNMRACGGGGMISGHARQVRV